ncbi:MAG: DUF3473 domain-containing protein, partial [Fibrobacter sp.]|nr:DUF3473 domain-containing protein [Fibrobacter sp.]
QQFRDDLSRSIALIGDITGQKVRYYRVPGFSIKKTNAWVLEILVESGIEIDSSIFPASRGHGGFEDFGSDTPVIIKTQAGKLKEFPINTSLFLGRRIVFSGGGYFRLLPYSILYNFMKKSSYVMSYFHPRDFDPDQPLLPGLNFNRRFKSYYGISGALKKLSRIMSDFEFTDLRTAESMIDWFARAGEPKKLSNGMILQPQM